MKIGIHHRAGSFSENWIKFCENNGVSYKLVNCYENDIIDQLRDCEGLMWHWHQSDYRAVLFAKELTYSLEMMGKRVFPDSNTVWHFDDKIGQKYLLEAINAPLVPSYVFYNKKEALAWIQNVPFPKVFKLRGGAGSRNVKLAENKKAAASLINQAFGRGFSASDRMNDLADRLRNLKKKRSLTALMRVMKGMARLIIPNEFEKMHGLEKGYVYFQDFMLSNNYDTRIIVIGNKCFAIRRYNREGDFRASGSGLIRYEPELFDKRCMEIAFDVSDKLNAQCISYDFIFDSRNNPLIVEISYGFTPKVYDKCPGFWDKDLIWHEGSFNPQYFMIEEFLKSIKEKEVIF